MTPARRIARRVAAIVLALWSLPVTAAAHGGVLLASARAGPFQITVTAAPLLVSGQAEAVDYTAYVNDAATGNPVADAHAEYAIHGADGVTRPRVQLIGGGYEAIVPTRNARTSYASVPLTLAVTSPAGRGTLAITPTAGGSTGPPGWLYPVTAIVCLVLVAAARRVRVSRSRDAQRTQGRELRT